MEAGEVKLNNGAIRAGSINNGDRFIDSANHPNGMQVKGFNRVMDKALALNIILLNQ